MSEEYGGYDAGTAGQLLALPLQISDVGVAVSHTNACPHFQMTFDSKCASQYLCFDVTPPFSSIMTRSPRTTLHRVFPQLFLTPPQLFGFTPHLSSHLTLNPQIFSFLPALCPPNPQTPFSSFRHRSRESCTRSKHAAAHHAATLPLCKDSRPSGVVSGLGLDDGNGIPISAHNRVQYPNVTGQKGRASLL
jgi:hypothetical protein